MTSALLSDYFPLQLKGDALAIEVVYTSGGVDTLDNISTFSCPKGRRGASVMRSESFRALA